MPTRQVTTTLKDAEGVEHQYSCATFPAGEGADLLLEIGEILSGPLGHAAAILFGGDEKTGEMDLSALPDALQDIPKIIIAKGGSKLIQRILFMCRRESEDEKGKTYTDHLRSVDTFNHVYAGNYLEMFRAVYWVLVEVNFGPFFAVNMTQLTGLWSKLASFTQIEPTPGEAKKSEPKKTHGKRRARSAKTR